MRVLVLLLLVACVDAGPRPRPASRIPVTMQSTKKKCCVRVALDDPDTAWARGNVPPCRWTLMEDSLGPYKVRRCPRKGDPERKP